MLPIGGLFTALFVLTRWGIKDFIDELQSGMEKSELNPGIVRILFMVSAIVVGFILFNEVIDILTGNPIIG